MLEILTDFIIGVLRVIAGFIKGILREVFQEYLGAVFHFVWLRVVKRKKVTFHDIYFEKKEIYKMNNDSWGCLLMVIIVIGIAVCNKFNLL